MNSRLALLLLGLLIGSVFAQRDIGYCYVSPTGTAGTNPVRGKITWVLVSSGVTSFVFDLQGLGPNAVRAFHAHTYGSIYSTDGLAVSSHFDPRGTSTHANPVIDGILAANHHAGDFGNVTAAANGTASYMHEYTFDQVQLNAANSIIGRALIIHEKPDSGFAANATNGNAGARHGQCVVQAASYADYNVARDTEGVRYASADLKVDMYSNVVKGRVAFETVDSGMNFRARLCGLPSNANVSIVIGDFSDVMSNSTFFAYTRGFTYPVTANANGVVDYAVNTTDLDFGGLDRSVQGRPIGVVDTTRNLILARGIVGISSMRVPLNAAQGSNIYPTCEPSGPQPTPSQPGPQPGSAGQLFMGVSTIMLLIASFLLF